MKNSLFLALLLALSVALPALSQETAPAPAKLSAREAKDVARIETYLNRLKSVEANFLQISDTGGLRHGTIALKRPGKMRVTYDPPSRDFMVCDGSFLHIWDDQLQQQTSVSASSGIASFILRKNISLSKDVVLTRFVRYPAKIEIDLVSKDKPEEGELTLIFEDKPLKLRQWRVRDPQGSVTGVSLENARENVSFVSNLFVFVPPNIGKRGD